MRHRGSHIIITGGYGDIGVACAARLVAEGAKVTLFDCREPGAGAAELLTNPAVAGHQVDVTDRQAVEAALEHIWPFDTVLANAGIVESAPFLDITAEQWQKHIDVNLSGVFNVVQLSARIMVRNEAPGMLILTGSWVGAVPWPEIAAYATTKAAIVMLGKSAARELASDGIRVNIVAPGIVAAGLAKRQMETEPQYAARVARVIPTGAPQTAEEVAGVVSFLCSSDAASMTGSVLLADGGCSLFKFD